MADRDCVFFKAHAKRGHKAIDDTFDKGLPDTVLVTDRHGAYFSMLMVKTHQICLVHLQRNLVYLTELQPENQWPKDMLNLITDAMKQRREKAWDEIDREGLKNDWTNYLTDLLELKTRSLLVCRRDCAVKGLYLHFP